jgi:hypothetical protein
MSEVNGSNQQQEKKKKLDQQVVFWSLVGVGTASFWCCVAIAFFAYQNRGTIQNPFGPHAYLTPPPGVDIFRETFENNDNNWGRVYGSRVNVENGKLTVKAAHETMAGATRCFGCDYLGDSFYYQAEIASQEPTDKEYGLIFCASGMDGEQYTLLIEPEQSTFSLLKERNNTRQRLTETVYSDQIKPYPETNTLGIYFDQGLTEIYINGSMELSVTDSNPYPCMWSGIIIIDGTVTLTVDNVMAYSMPWSDIP